MLAKFTRGMIPLCFIFGGYLTQGQVQEKFLGKGEIRFQNALDKLSQLPSGKVLILKAQALWKESGTAGLSQHFQWGESSRTDTVLTRHYSPPTDHEKVEREVTVYLREDQSDSELILDIAHELVHATARSGFDPYDPTLTPGKYVQIALEGEGGEVAAVIQECEVGIDLSIRAGKMIERCQGYLTSPGLSAPVRVDRDQIRRDFYRVGKWYNSLVQNLGSERELFPWLSAEIPHFYSSTGHTPYPSALFDEFQEITTRACENSRKRMMSVASREPALGLGFFQNPQLAARRFVRSRCRSP